GRRDPPGLDADLDLRRRIAHASPARLRRAMMTRVRGVGSDGREQCRAKPGTAAMFKPARLAPWSLMISLPDQPQAFECEEGIDELDGLRVRCDEVRQSTGRDRARVRAELAADPPDDSVHLSREPVNESRLEARDG